MADMQFFTYYRSSASYRVRIALNLKGLHAQHVPVNLAENAQFDAEYAHQNPQKLVPLLLTDEGATLMQSMAIMEYLEEHYTDAPTLLPADVLGRARVRALAQAIACEMAPLNNLRVLRYLVQDMQLNEAQKLQWYQHWIATGFEAVEAMLQPPQTGTYCHGNVPSIADCCLVPQVYNAQRFDCDLEAYPTILRIAETCNTLPAFKQAHPAQQPDAV
jgi:maleylacetoacetate isomerase